MSLRGGPSALSCAVFAVSLGALNLTLWQVSVLHNAAKWQLSVLHNAAKKHEPKRERKQQQQESHAHVSESHAWQCPDFVMTPGLFGHGNKLLYTSEGLCRAAAAYNLLHPHRMFLGSFNETRKRQELSAFLAHVKHESAGMTAVREYRCCTNMQGSICKESIQKKDCSYCDPTRPASAADSACPCNISNHGQSSKLFYGRGPLQLSWNFHYGAMAHAFNDQKICKQPDVIADVPEYLWGSAIWYWMEQHDPKCTYDNCHNLLFGQGFGATTRNINGCLECDGKQDEKVCTRANMFKSNCAKLGVPPLIPLNCGGRSCENRCSKCRDDLKCGSRGSLADGTPAECDPKGAFSCCSKQGWCGTTYGHCKCEGCIDFRRNLER